MKRLISFLLFAAILCGLSIPAAAAEADNLIQPRWSYLNAVAAYLDINWLGIATCEGSAAARSAVDVKVVVRLQQQTETGWATIETWSATGTAGATAGGKYAVYKGYTYRTSVTAYVYDENGNIVETGGSTDTFVY